jgi:hypothetical protein
MKRVAVLLVASLSACTVGELPTEGGGGGGGGGGGAVPDANSGGGGGGGTPDAAVAAATGLSVTFTTSPTAAPVYDPAHVVAVWIQDSGGAFVKTIGRYAGTRKQYLLGWIAKAGTNDADAVSGASPTDHAPLTVTWDLKNKAGTVVPDGTYTIRMESTDKNATAISQNNEGTFTFVKGTAAQTQTALSNGGFSNVSIKFTP